MFKVIAIFQVIIFGLSGSSAFAQISGEIKDSQTGNLLDNAVVFLNKTTFSTSSNAIGEFSISGVKPGIAEVIVYKKGYQLFRSRIQIKAGHAIRVPLELHPEKKQVYPGSPIKEGKERSMVLHQLERALLGSGQDIVQCKIMNEPSLSFSKSQGIVTLSATGPVVIVNPYTGYKIYCYPNPADPDVRHLLDDMALRFDTLSPHDATQLKEWSDVRESYFVGSTRHLFSSIVRQQAMQQGFTLLNGNGDTLKISNLTDRSKVGGYTTIRLVGRTNVIFHPAGGAPKNSYITIQNTISADADGNLLDEKSVLVEGDMKMAGLSRLVPLNFFPEATVKAIAAQPDVIRLLQEKVYVQTDKPYYYPGEVIWMKGYMNYTEPELRDSLSRVLYLELIDPLKNVVQTKILKIDSGMTWGDLSLPSSLKAGDYQLRAYTNLMKNFSADNVFRKAVPILNETDKPDDAGVKRNTISSDGFSINADKASYNPRDPVRLIIKAVDEDQEPVFANVSISVTDAAQVVPVSEQVSITANYLFKKEDGSSNQRALRYPEERGISFTGQFLNDTHKREKAQLTMLQNGFAALSTVTTSADGFFQQSNYQFYDSMEIFYMAKNSQGSPYGSVTVLPREILPVENIDPLDLKMIHTQTNQRVNQEEMMPIAPKTLRQVNITSTKNEGSKFISRTYNMGQRNRIFKGDLFKGTDMAEALAQSIPTLKLLNGVSGRYLTFQMNVSFVTISNRPYVEAKGTTLPSEPLIYYNDSYIGGGPQSAVNALLNITPANVDHVEVIYGVPHNRMIEIQGGYGLIAIYSKPDATLKGFKNITVPGYSRPHLFHTPDYNKPNEASAKIDSRSTIYWNPNITVEPSPEPTMVSFVAADVPGNYHVVAEGVTEKGVPIRAEFYFEVK